MKKKFTGILMCFLVLCMTIFTGCGLVGVDNDKYYNSVVAEVKTNDGKLIAQITSRELIDGYQSTGYYYEYAYGMSRSEAVKETLQLLENRKIIVHEAEKDFGIDSTGKGLEPMEKTYIWETTVEALKSNLDYYYNEIVGTKEEDKEESEKITFEGYTKNAKLVPDGEGGYLIEKTNQKAGLLGDYYPSVSHKDYNVKADRELIYENMVESLSGKYVDAYNRYFKQLLNSEKGLDLSTDAKSVFAREIDKLYTQSYENYVVEKYTQGVTAAGDISSISVQDILDLYSSKVRADYTQYVLEKDSAYSSDMKENLADINYFVEGNDTKFFTVANILFSFNKTQEADYAKYKAAGDEASINSLYESIELLFREYDVETDSYQEVENEDNQTVDGVIENQIKVALKNAQNTNDVATIGETINNLVYTYNQDPGMFNAATNYVIGINKDGSYVSDWVAEFNEAGKILYNDGEGKIGDVAIAKTSFGIHVLVYTGECTNLFSGVDSSFNLQNYTVEEGELSPIEVLYNTRVNPLVDKTYFDVLYDELYVDNSSYVQEANISMLRTNYKIKTYSGRIPDILKG